LHGLIRKPNNAYSYTPYTSNHSKSCLHGIVSTECVRLQRVCGSTEEFKKECTFFAKKLREKAYRVQTVREIIDEYCWNNRQKKIKNNNKHIVVPFKMQFCVGAESLGISSILNESATKWLSEDARQYFKFVTAYTTARNLFRLRYARFL